MADLYMFYLGGTARGTNIELHDVQFAAVENPKDAYPKLAANWFGETKFLHIDVEARINWADGYDVSLSDEKQEGAPGLFFVHMGGYVEGHLDEKHSYDLIVARDKREARQRAKAAFQDGKLLPHRDMLVEVDTCIQIRSLNGKYVHLEPNPHGRRDTPKYPYTPIGAEIAGWDQEVESALSGED